MAQSEQPSPFKRVRIDLELEQDRQRTKWGKQHHSADKWFRILGEEFGEIAHAINEDDHDNMVEEIIQTMAVCATWLEDIYESAGQGEPPPTG